MPRIFVAIPLPREVADGVAHLVPPLPGLRPVAPDLMHVTLAFVGQVGEERVPDVAAAVAAAAGRSAAFRLELNAIGRFPERGRPNVIWVGADAATADAIVRVGAAVRAELLRHRVPLDPKPLRAHVTLARVRERVSADEARAIDEAIRDARVATPLSFRVASVHVLESKLSAGGPPGRITGPLYSSRAEVPLAGPPGRMAGPPGRMEGPPR